MGIAGHKRVRYTDGVLVNFGNKLESAYKVIQKVKQGDPFTVAAEQEGFKYHQFRSLLEQLDRMEMNTSYKDNKVPCSVSPDKEFDFDLTGIEALYADIFAIHVEDWWQFRLPNDAQETVDFVLCQLTEREKKVIERYYIDGLTLEEVGKEFGVTRDRIRQICAKGIRKMRHPQRAHILQVGMEAFMEEEKLRKQMEKEKTDAVLARHREEIEQIKSESSRFPLEEILLTGIGELELSVRSFNCLRRANINTVYDICHRVDDINSNKVRNLGRKSADEVHARVMNLFERSHIDRDTAKAIAQKCKDTDYTVDMVADGVYRWSINSGKEFQE